MNSKTTIFAFCLTLFTACADAPDPETSAQLAIDAASELYARSQDMGHAWVQTGVRLEAAKAAMDSKVYSVALSEAERSAQLAQASLVQAETELDSWSARFPSLPKELPKETNANESP